MAFQRKLSGHWGKGSCPLGRSCDHELSSIGQGSFADRPPLDIGATDRPTLEIGASSHVTWHGELQLLVTYYVICTGLKSVMIPYQTFGEAAKMNRQPCIANGIASPNSSTFQWQLFIKGSALAKILPPHPDCSLVGFDQGLSASQ